MGLEHWSLRTNVRKKKDLLKALANLLTREIQKRSTARDPLYLDYRFLLILSQWLAEQAGYTIDPAGNNPGNVMGGGDAGSFHRSTNHEVVNGKLTVVPADFAAYSTIEAGTSATFEQLWDKWPVAYNALMNGGSMELYVQGLYPGRGNYATQPHSTYLGRLRFRLSNCITDYIEVAKDDLKQVNEFVAGLGKSGGTDVDQATGQAEMMKAVFEDTLTELQAIQVRVRAAHDIQP
jgi:hypothetical protein